MGGDLAGGINYFLNQYVALDFKLGLSYLSSTADENSISCTGRSTSSFTLVKTADDDSSVTTSITIYGL